MIENWARSQRRPVASREASSQSDDQAITYGLFSEQENSKDVSVEQDITGNTVREHEVEIIGSERGLASDKQVDRPPEPEVQGAAALPPKEVVQQTTEVTKKPTTAQPAGKDIVQAERERALRETL